MIFICLNGFYYFYSSIANTYLLRNENYHIDKELFIRISKGEEDAFRQVVEFYYKKWLPLTIYLLKSEPDARDILQDVFLKLWINRSSLAEVDNPEGWLHVVVSNASSNHIRSRLRYELRVKKLISANPEAEEIGADLEARFTKSLIDEAVNQLPLKRKQVFLLSRREGLSRKEIADHLDISENTVRNQLAEAIEFIRGHLERKGTLVIPTIIICQFS